MESCFDILNQKKTVREWNVTNIALIPKVHSPKFITDYRSISLLNVSYKIVSKVLANQLRVVLSKIISNSQSAFISRRAIADNIIGHENLHFIKKKKEEMTALLP